MKLPVLQIRRARPSDVTVVAEFNLRLAVESEGLRLDADCVRAGVAAVLRDEAKGIYFVAEIGGVIAGQLMITYEWSDWRNATIWWLQSVYVKEEFRRQGVFRALLAHLRKQAIERKDVCSLRLYVHGDNARAGQAYERLGLGRTRYEVREMELTSGPKGTRGG